MSQHWTRYYKIVTPQPATKTIQDSQDVSGGTLYNSHSWYQRLVQGSSTRQTRYREYDGMDNDVDISRALDTIAQEMTPLNKKTDLYIDIQLNERDGRVNGSVMDTLNVAARYWSNTHCFDQTLFGIARNTIKNGDCFFRKHKGALGKWEYIHAKNVIAAVVDENDVTSIVAWQIRRDTNKAQANLGGIGVGGQQYESEFVPADEIVWFTLNDNMSETAPFGESILKPVYRAFKQKELLQDAIIIYRISRAPERRVFYIDVGKMPPQRTKQYLEQIKNEIKQKKIPTQNSKGEGQVESIYNPASVSEDFYFAQRCISLNTQIPLLDGRVLTLQNLIDEHNQGKQNYTYSVDQSTGRFIPGEIEWAGITRKNAEVVKVTLDNGEQIVCTPDHKFVLRDGSEVEAQYLETNTSLMPLYRKNVKTNKNQKKSLYEMQLNNESGKWEFTHLMTSPKTQLNTVIHHVDYNPGNNNPTNLLEMDTDEHWKLHSENGHTFGYMWEHHREYMLQCIRDYYDNITPEQKELMIERNTKNGRSTWILHKDQILSQLEFNRSKFRDSMSPEEYTTHFQNMSRKMWENISDDELELRRNKQIQYNKQNKAYVISDKMFEIFVDLYNNGCNSLPSMVAALRNSDEFFEEFIVSNSHLDRTRRLFSPNTIYKICEHGGYNNFNDFKQQYKVNHKVVQVEWLDSKEDTGCLTIKDPGDNHNFAVHAGVYIKNSDGKGSRVETLPGGNSVGELGDLEFWHRTVYRGLRIPTSYMQLSSNDTNPIFNDGRIGQAYIEELEFAKYCMRLQRNIEATLDREFKLYLRGLGINIDPQLFNIKLPTPTNFGIYKQQEVDSAILSTLSTADGIPFFSKRFVLSRFGQMEEDEILRNEKMRCQELGIDPNDPERFKKIYGTPEEEDSFGGISDFGGSDLGGEMSSGVDFDIDSELGGEEMGEEMGEEEPEKPIE